MTQDDLKVGSKISYAGFGPGEVTDIVERALQGSVARFAVLNIPHQGMNAQIPLANAAIIERLRPIVSSDLAAKLIHPPKRAGRVKLASAWTERRDRVRQLLEQNDPQVWADVYWAYADFAATGVLLTVADLDNIDRSNSLLAAECAYALGQDYLDLTLTLRGTWQRRVADLTKKHKKDKAAAEAAAD